MSDMGFNRDILKELASENFEERHKLIEFLSSIHEEELYLNVSELLSSEDAIVRNSSIEIMTAWGSRVLNILIDKTKSPESNQRLYAANILGEIKEHISVEALLSLLTDEESNVRFAAAEAIGKIGSKEATMPLLHYLDSRKDDPWEQFPLILTLGQLGDERAVIPLLQLAENEMLQQPVLQAIGNIADEHAIPYIFEVLRSSDSTMNSMGILAIKNIREKIKKYKLGEDNFNQVIQKQFAKMSQDEMKIIINNLTECLEHEDYSIKPGVIFLLGLTNSPEALKTLISHYNTDLAPEIEEGLLNLGKLNSSCLINSLDSENLTCCEIIIRLLGQLKINKALEQIIKHLEHPMPEVRVESALALGQFLKPETIPLLIKLLNDSSVDVQNAAVKTLQSFGRDIVLNDILKHLEEKTLTNIESLIVTILSELKPPVDVNEILKFASSPDFEIRRTIAQALRNYNDEEAAETLMHFLSDPHPQIREEAIRSLEDRGEKITDALISALGDQAPWVRYCAAKALAKQKVNEKIIDSLAILLDDNFPFVQIAAIESLGSLKADKYCDKLFEFISNPDSDISQAAIISLSSINLSEHKIKLFQGLLENQIENPNWIVRKAIATALGSIKTDDSFNFLLKMLDQEKENLVDKEILLSLGKLSDLWETIPLLINFTNVPRLRENTLDVIVNLGKKVVPYLQKVIDNEDAEVRANIVSILSMINDPKAIQILVKTVSSDSSPNVRKQTVLALNNFSNDQRAIWAIMWVANHDPDTLVMQTAKSLLVS